ncbi:MAG: AMP-binding protein [Rhodospirillales bacterium]|jgi:long-chain acyl-CoA synthetase
MNIAHHLDRMADLRPEQPALGHGERVVADFGVLRARVARLAGALRDRLALRPGDRVAVLMSNAPAYVEILYACWWAGLAAVPVNAKLHAREVAYVLDHSGARLVFVSPDTAATFAAAARETGGPAPIAIEAGSAEYETLVAADAVTLAVVDAGDLAWLFYTSGTTGRPKGAMLSHRNLLAATMSYFVDIDPPCSGGSQIHAAPLSHGSGLYMLPSIAQGNCQVVPASGHFDPGELFDLFRRWPHVSMFAAPTMIKRLVDHPGSASASLDNLRVVVWGGAPMYVADIEAALGRFGYRFAQLYGQGESPMTITGMSRAMLERFHRAGDRAGLASAGWAQSVVRVRVADAEDRPLAAGEPGEILARGDSVMAGYWRNPEATAATLRGGWLHTGDVGELDARGLLTLRDRSKDLIISGGSNIYPREVEEVLLLHPGVAECAVIGLADPDWGETVLAFVVARAPGAVDAAALDRLCLDNIARFKRPKAYRFVAALPKSNYGKILKTELRAWAGGD